MWNRVDRDVEPSPRALPERTWRQRTPARSACSTPWSTFRKVFMTDDLLLFACKEFNHYPKFLAVNRTRPPYIAKNKAWPPVWVNQTGVKGPMNLAPKQYLKYLTILYLIGVKGLNNTNLDDLFSTDPIMREEWLCKITTRQDLGRFLRQVSMHCCSCVVCLRRPGNRLKAEPPPFNKKTDVFACYPSGEFIKYNIITRKQIVELL